MSPRQAAGGCARARSTCPPCVHARGVRRRPPLRLPRRGAAALPCDHCLWQLREPLAWESGCAWFQTPDPPADEDLDRASDDPKDGDSFARSEEHTSELQSQSNLVCRLLLEKKNKNSQ